MLKKILVLAALLPLISFAQSNDIKGKWEYKYEDELHIRYEVFEHDNMYYAKVTYYSYQSEVWTPSEDEDTFVFFDLKKTDLNIYHGKYYEFEENEVYDVKLEHISDNEIKVTSFEDDEEEIILKRISDN